jgi:Initiator Replication protein
MKQTQIEVVKEIQNDPSKVIISNFLTILSFKKPIGDSFFDVDIKEIGTHIPKIVWETVSMLKYEDIENATNGVIIKRLYIKEFLKKIGSNENNYKHIINGARILRAWEIATVEDGKAKYKGFFSEVTHDPKTGYLDLEIKVSWAKVVLEVAEKGNVSFLTRYLHILQNSHAINLYPTLQAHVYKGKYEISVEDFKNTFNYNSTGYKKFSNLKTYVLEPAIQELNEKSDLIIYCEPTGSNLESKKPRVIGLIFWIKEKPKLKQPSKPQDEPSHISNKIKDVPFVEVQDEPKQEPQPRKEQPKPQSITTPPPTGASVPSEAEIQQLADKLKLNPEQVQAIKDKLNNDNIKTWEALQGCINEAQNSPKNSYFAYILGSTGLGVGLWNEKQAKVKKLQTQQIEQQKQAFIQQIKADYTKRKYNHFKELYNKSTDEQREQYIDLLKAETRGEGRNTYNLFIDLATKEIKDLGILRIGEEIGEQKGFGKDYRQNIYRNEVLNKHHTQIDFDEQDEVIIISLFDAQPQDEPQPQSITTPPPTAPSMATAPLPQVSEVVEPTEPPHEDKEQEEQEQEDENHKSREQLGRLSSTEVEEMKRVETPKSLGDLLKSGANNLLNKFKK